MVKFHKKLIKVLKFIKIESSRKNSFEEFDGPSLIEKEELSTMKLPSVKQSRIKNNG